MGTVLQKVAAHFIEFSALILDHCCFRYIAVHPVGDVVAILSAQNVYILSTVAAFLHELISTTIHCPHAH